MVTDFGDTDSQNDTNADPVLKEVLQKVKGITVDSVTDVAGAGRWDPTRMEVHPHVTATAEKS